MDSKFISTVGILAVDTMGGTGLFPSVAIAQAILESNWGKSKLASEHKNLFGIKTTKSWKGQSVDMSTGEVINGQAVTMVQPFRKYKDWEESMKDRTRFLRQNPRYSTAGVFKATTPIQQATALQKAGYATGGNYAAKINQIIENYNLTRFDLLLKKKG